jgi:hypothetical protein
MSLEQRQRLRVFAHRGIHAARRDLARFDHGQLGHDLQILLADQRVAHLHDQVRGSDRDLDQRGRAARGIADDAQVGTLCREAHGQGVLAASSFFFFFTCSTAMRLALPSVATVVTSSALLRSNAVP